MTVTFLRSAFHLAKLSPLDFGFENPIASGLWFVRRGTGCDRDSVCARVRPRVTTIL